MQVRRTNPTRILYEEPSLVVSDIYLGNIDDANDVRHLRALGVTGVLNCAYGPGMWFENKYGPHMQFMGIPMLDIESYPISEHFHDTNNFIDRVLTAGGKVLVHCIAGASRSPTVVAAWMISHLGIPAWLALEIIKNTRPIITPNEGFLHQLVKYQRELGIE